MQNRKRHRVISDDKCVLLGQEIKHIFNFCQIKVSRWALLITHSYFVILHFLTIELKCKRLFPCCEWGLLLFLVRAIDCLHSSLFTMVDWKWNSDIYGSPFKMRHFKCHIIVNPPKHCNLSSLRKYNR